ncbi:MAG: hypothetical protein FWG85_02455 [Bacteroidetes bacterium]|nr:hypothetical protein [Bacteroidota bacterium]
MPDTCAFTSDCVRVGGAAAVKVIGVCAIKLAVARKSSKTTTRFVVGIPPPV